MSPGRGPSRARRPPSRHPRPASRPAVELAVRDGVAWMTLARPASGNRLDAELLGALVEGSAAAEDDDGVRVVVLAAEGPAFSLGLPRACRWPERSWPDGVGAVAGLTKPVIAAIQGAALGWGLALALACDLRLASTTAVLALPALGERRFPGGGVTQRLPRMIGTARALAAKGPLALRLGKEAVVRALDLPLADGIRLEHDLYVLLQTTADRRAGIEAFLARRKPRFGGR